MLKIQFRMIMAKHLIHFLTNLLMSYTFTEAKGNCDTGFCQTYPFDIYGDALQEKELVAHVFYNSVTPNPVQCYLWCIHDCRCLSFNYKERKTPVTASWTMPAILPTTVPLNVRQDPVTTILGGYISEKWIITLVCHDLSLLKRGNFLGLILFYVNIYS